jgi:hypothetical protein
MSERSKSTTTLGPDPVTSLDDPRAVQILTAEHGSLLAARSLAYNEAFVRTGNFLAFLSTSFVGVALVAQVLPDLRGLLLVTAIVLAFDLVVGLTTYGRTLAAGYEDYRAVQGMAKIRHGYGDIAPIVLPYFADTTHDDLAGVMVTYGSPPVRGAGAVVYNLTTSTGTMALIDAMLAGVLILVAVLGLGAAPPVGIVAGAAAGCALFATLAVGTYRYYNDVQARLEVAFPTPSSGDGEAGLPT